MDRLPRWADVALVPFVSLLLAAIISALVIIAIGQDPWEAITTMVKGSVMDAYGWGYTLYYATSFIFTGLAVTVAFHAGLFNIGGEGPIGRPARGGAHRPAAGPARVHRFSRGRGSPSVCHRTSRRCGRTAT